MNYSQFARMVSLVALIVSPTVVLLMMQMPLWLPPQPVALERVVRADFASLWIDRDPASWAETVVPACPASYDDFCGATGISGRLLK